MDHRAVLLFHDHGPRLTAALSAGWRTVQINGNSMLMLCRLLQASSCSSGSKHLVGTADLGLCPGVAQRRDKIMQMGDASLFCNGNISSIPLPGLLGGVFKESSCELSQKCSDKPPRVAEAPVRSWH